MRNANMASRRKRGGFFYHDVIKTVPFRDSFRTIENGEKKTYVWKKNTSPRFRAVERLDALLIRRRDRGRGRGKRVGNGKIGGH